MLRLSNDLKWVLRQHKPYAFTYLSAIACVLVSAILVLVDPLVMKWLIDVALPEKRLTGVLAVAGYFLFAFSCRTPLNRLSDYLMLRVSQGVGFRIRMKLLRHLHALPAAYHDRAAVGDMMDRLLDDVNDVASLGDDVLIVALRTIAVTTGSLAVVCSFNPRLLLVAVPWIPIFMLVRRHFLVDLKQLSRKCNTLSGKKSALLNEHLSIMVQLQLLCRELTHARKVAAAVHMLMRAQRERKTKETFYAMLSMLPLNLASILLLGYGGYQVTVGALTVGGLVAAYGYLNKVFDPLGDVAGIDIKLQRVGASVRRVLDVFDEKPFLADTDESFALSPNGKTTLEFENVTFSYNGTDSVVEAISFTVDGGQKVAIAGKSGSGKSTIGKLAARVCVAGSGTIRLGGHDIRQIRRQSLRSAIVLLPQQPAVISGTVRENLLYGNPSATMDDLLQVTTIAQIDDKILGLPKQWDEVIGPQGNTWSGGERQRLVLARTLLQRPRFLILDECTSAVDGPTEDAILSGLDRYRGDMSIIVISHRITSLQWADRVVVIDHGRVIEDAPSGIFAPHKYGLSVAMTQ